MKKIFTFLFFLAGLAIQAQTIYPGTVSYPSTQTICAGDVPAAFLSTSAATVSAGSITYQWQESIISTTAGFTDIPGANGAAFAPGSVAQTTYYRRAASTSPSNVDYSNVLTVNVFPLQLAYINGPATICSATSTSLTAATGGTNYAWSVGGSNSTVTVFSPTMNGVASVTIYPITGCSVSATHAFTVNPAPSATIQQVNALTCAGLSNTLQASPSSGMAYFWFPGNKAGANFIVTPTTTTEYTLHAEDFNFCTATFVYTLVVTPSPTLVATASSSMLCKGDSVELSVSGALTYTWLPAGLNTASITVSPTAATVYTVIGEDATCPGLDTVSVGVYPTMTVNIQLNKNTICLNESAILTASGGTSYVWQNQGISVTTATVIVTPTLTTTYSVLVTSVNNCTETAVRTLSVSQCTGISELENALSLSVYPNPNNGAFTIASSGNQDIRLVNYSGQVIRQFRLNEQNTHQVTVSDLSEGIYFIITDSADSQAVRQKVVVIR